MGFFGAVAAATGNGKLDRLCREVGWPVDIRKGNGIGLHFNGDRITPRRTVYVFHVEGKPIIGFHCKCRAEFRERSLPDNLLAAMLVHNDKVTIGAWNATLEGGAVGLCLSYTAPASGVDATNFKMICTLMVQEVGEIEAGLQRKGLL